MPVNPELNEAINEYRFVRENATPKSQRVYGRRDPLEYYYNPNLSPRTMAQIGSITGRRAWLISFARSTKILLTALLYAAIPMLLSLPLLGWGAVVGLLVAVLPCAAFVYMFYLPYFFGRMKMYYRPQIHDQVHG